MSEDPTQLMFRVLRERFDEQQQQLATLNKKFDDWQETTATGLGLASHANIRNSAVEAERALKRGVATLEGSLGTPGH